MSYFKFLKYIVTASVLCVCLVQAQNPAKFIPNQEDYAPFIYGKYDPNKMSVLVFKDPFCPYCIRAIDGLNQLDGYNVFVFWAPILGDKSVSRVSAFFKCDKLANTDILTAVKNRTEPPCTGEHNSDNMFKNLNMVNNYNISAVPSYFLQGQSTSLRSLISQKPGNPSINGVKLDWARYTLMQENSRDVAKILGLVIPEEKKYLHHELITKYKPQYVFSAPSLAANKSNWNSCNLEDSACQQKQSQLYKKRRLEFDLLLGHTFDTARIAVIDFNGKLTSL